MIYALTANSTEPHVRTEIAEEVLAPRNLQGYVAEGTIVHIRDVADGQQCYCIFCRHEVRPSSRNPVQRRRPQAHWYFEHVDLPGCVGTNRELGGDLVNPAEHGCYHLLGWGTHPPGNCRCRGYCHYAFAPCE